MTASTGGAYSAAPKWCARRLVLFLPSFPRDRESILDSAFGRLQALRLQEPKSKIKWVPAFCGNDAKRRASKEESEEQGTGFRLSPE
jgi:hypothetical protein